MFHIGDFDDCKDKHNNDKNSIGEDEHAANDFTFCAPVARPRVAFGQMEGIRVTRDLVDAQAALLEACSAGFPARACMRACALIDWRLPVLRRPPCALQARTCGP